MAPRTAKQRVMQALSGGKRKINHYEIALQKSVIEFLRLALPSDAMVVGYVFGRTNERDGARAKAMGALDGFPDLFIIWRGDIYCIELKNDGEKASFNQAGRHHEIRLAGACVAVAHSIAEVERLCIYWGIPLRVTTAAR